MVLGAEFRLLVVIGCVADDVTSQQKCNNIHTPPEINPAKSPFNWRNKMRIPATKGYEQILKIKLTTCKNLVNRVQVNLRNCSNECRHRKTFI